MRIPRALRALRIPPLRAGPAVPVLAALALLAAPVQAGSPEDPEVTDPVGDAGPVPSPAGFEWADITAAWFEERDAGVRLTIAVAALDHDPPGEVGVHFRVGGTWWLAGWTTILFPAPPFTYAGGFSCQAEADGSVPDASTCDSLAATAGGGVFTVDLPPGTFGLAPGAAIEEPRGYAVDVVSAQPEVQAGWIEVTAPGRAFVLPAKTGAEPVDGEVPSAAPGLVDDPDPVVEADDADDGMGRGRGTPGPMGWLAGLALLAAAFARRRAGGTR